MTSTSPHSGKGDGSSVERVHLTFDIDWAPDESVDVIRRILNQQHIKATFFITHNSDIIRDLTNDGHEIGIHPNFLPNSSQGDNPENVIDFLLNIVPQARTLRSHALVQSSPLLETIFSKFPQLKYDLSIFMYGFPLVQPFNWAFEKTSFTRINYNWEDDAAFFQDGFGWDDLYFPGHLSVYGFHPIHVHLNSKDNLNYNELKRSIDIPLSKVSAKIISQHANPESGTRTFLEALVKANAEHLCFEELTCG